MTGPALRRRDPQPIGRPGEIALLVIVGGLVLLAAGGLLGLGAASAVFGGGWVWPAGPALDHTLGGLLTGHPGRGLPPAAAAKVPAGAAVYVAVAVAEVCLGATATWAALVIGREMRPGDARGGMASRAEAADAAGVGQLRRARKIIRPDLYGRSRDQASDVGEGER